MSLTGMTEDKTLVNVSRRCPECKSTFGTDAAKCPHDGTLLLPFQQQDALIGSLFAGRYRIEKEIGRGGMSIVYKGMHELMHRPVAIKIMQAELLADPVSVRRFQQESEAASRLAHPHVVTAFDFGVTDASQPYLVLDFVEGTSLADEIKKDGKLLPKRTIHIFKQICDALDQAHQRGVVHRDLKPSNIMLINAPNDPDFVKVVDFGIAKLMSTAEREPLSLTKSGEIFGSPLYMSPEQCKGTQPDPRTDVYAAGIMLYEALTGQPPIAGASFFETMQMQISTQPRPFKSVDADLKLPAQLEAVVFKALQKKPEHRYQSMRELGSALGSVSRTHGYEEEQPASGPEPAKSQMMKQARIIVPLVIGFIMWLGVKIMSPAPTQAPPQSEQKVKGEIFYYDTHAKLPYMVINSEFGSQPIYLGESRLEHRVPDAANSVRNGAHWTVTYRIEDKKAWLSEKETSFDGSFDENILAADAMIRSHYKNMATGNYDEAWKDFGKGYVTKPKETTFAEWKLLGWRKDSDQAPVYAIQFLQRAGRGMSVLVDGSFFLTGAKKFWSMSLEKQDGRWKITNSETQEPPAEPN